MFGFIGIIWHIDGVAFGDPTWWQTVKIRVLALTPSLIPRAGVKVTVTVKDPRSFAMGRWADAEIDTHGVGPYELSSADP